MYHGLAFHFFNKRSFVFHKFVLFFSVVFFFFFLFSLNNSLLASAPVFKAIFFISLF